MLQKLKSDTEGLYMYTIKESSFNFTIGYDINNRKAGDTIYFIKKLSNFDNTDAIETNSYSTTYSNLIPGEYIFSVKGSYDKKKWTDSLIIKINIEKPFIFGLFFKILVVVVAILLVILIVKLFFKKPKIEV